MREIKFRAWDRYEEAMARQNDIYFGPMDHDDTLGSLLACLPERYALMQSTGLKDKNGVEIFEGDIIKNLKGVVGYIAFLQQEAGFVVVLSKSDYRLGHRNTGESYDVASGHEVLGNIYENTELLEGAWNEII